MDEMNKKPEEQNNEELKVQEISAPESTVADEPATKNPMPKAPIPKLPFIIGSVVAGVAAIAVTVAVVLGGAGNGNQGGGNTPDDNEHHHSYGEWTVVDDPTCTEAGLEERVCECDEKETRPIAALGHTEVVDEAVEATCKATGLTAGKHCSTCGTIIVAQSDVAKLPHTYDDTYDENCNVCGEEREAECAHAETETILGTAATCEATGLTDGTKCKKCGEIIVEQQTIPMVAHTYDNKYDEDCNVCGYKRDADCAHAETEVIIGKPATCTATGITDGSKCKKCGEIIVAQTTIPMAAHTETTIPAVNASCTQTGLTAGTKCSVCNKIIVAQQETPKAAHTYDNKYDEDCNVCGHKRDAECGHFETEIVNGYAATCTETGLTDGEKCKKCGETLVAQTSIPITPHAETTIQAVDATCSATGFTEGIKCSICGTILVAQQETPKIAHNYDDKYDEICNKCGFVRDAECAHTETEALPGRAATCTKTGVTEGEKCKKCGEIIVLQKSIPKAPHTEVIDAAVNATCTSTGLTEGKHCSVCNKVIVAQTSIPITPHAEVTDAAVDATCTSTGLTEGNHCSVCNKVIVAQTSIPITPHTEVIDAAVAATCTSTGLTEGKHCSVCSKVLVAQATVSMKPHTEVIDAAVAATCTSTGLTEGKHCSRCSKTLVTQNVVNALGHIEVVDEAVAATCTSTGLTEGKHCSRCSKTLITQNVVNALGHSIDNTTCSACGIIAISTVNDLLNVKPTGKYILLNNINLAGMKWTPLPIFSGTFDGNGYYISNFKITGTVSNAGLFIKNKGLIKNLGIKNITVDVENMAYNYTGSLAAANEGEIINCYVIGSVTGDSYKKCYVGGLVAYNSGEITDCYVIGNVTSSSYYESYAGGLIGCNEGIIKNCYATTKTNCSSEDYGYAGGLVGINYSTIVNCYATGDIASRTESKSCAGGLVGENNFGTIANCYFYDSYSTVISHSATEVSYAGGLVGCNPDGFIFNSYSMGYVISKTFAYYSYCGGLVGMNGNGVIRNCFATSNVTCESPAVCYAGGLTGDGYYGDIENCYRFSEQRFSVTQKGKFTNQPTNGSGNVASSFGSKEWIEKNLTWTEEIDIWSFNEKYPTLDSDKLNNTIIEISTAEELRRLQGQVLTKNYVLTNDIDLGGEEWIPISCLSGTFDGNGYTISNFKITGSVRFAGLFGYNCGTIKNLGVDGYVIDVDYSINLDIVQSSSYSSSYAGGLVAYNSCGKILNCHTSGIITDSSLYGYCGGLIGFSVDGKVTSCYSSSYVKGYYKVGGLIGECYDLIINDCYATGNVEGWNATGGLIGDSRGAYIINCYAIGNVVSRNSNAGGLVGNGIYGSISYCLATGNVNGKNDVGGLVGFLDNITINTCYRYNKQVFVVNKDGRITDKPTNTYGYEADMSRIQTAKFYTDTLGWSADDWYFVDGAYPTSK